MDRLSRTDAGGTTQKGPLPGEAAANGAGELKEYAAFYLAAKMDAVKLTLIKAAIFSALGVAGFIALLTLIVASTILLIGGLSEGVGRLVGSLWLGNLIIGAVFLGALSLGAFLALAAWKRRFHAKLVEKYERRKQRQRERWGRDVEERSSATASRE